MMNREKLISCFFCPAFSGKVFIFAVAVFLAVSSLSPRPAKAACSVCPCILAAQENLVTLIEAQHEDTRIFITNEFRYHEFWLVTDYFLDTILPAMMMLTEQLSAVAMQQMMIFGSFLDAKHQLETQRIFQQLAARAHKDYHPSEGLCTIGTATRSLAAANRNSDLTAITLAARTLDRQLGNVNSSASEGPFEDMESRVAQFRTTYCDPNDNNGSLPQICQGSPQARRNKDINFTRTIGAPLTLDINFANNGAPTPDEQDVFALASNLYGHTVFSNIDAAKLTSAGNQQLYLDLRSVAAKRGIAQMSFNAMAGMKAAGSAVGDAGGNTAQYLRPVLEELNMSDADITSILGANPSYYAQMEIITKKLLQRPDFYLDLYDKPANVVRKGVAIKALGLMQERDMLKSDLRSEAILSLILEMGLIKEQEELEDKILPKISEGSN